jgi:hypothetical protein
LRRSPFLLWGLLLWLPLSACSKASAPRPSSWSIGYWFWQGSSAAVEAPLALDDLYVQSGRMSLDPVGGWSVHADETGRLPAARRYWGVIRSDDPKAPSPSVSEALADHIRVLASNGRRNRHIAGLQLDIDVPTTQLRQYAAFLHDVRSKLPKEFQLSITALPDWFRDGTSIGDVVAAVDEFVPQFYDLQDPGMRDMAVADPFDAGKWAPRFNQFKKPYRIGLSTFGRGRLTEAVAPSPTGSYRVSYYRNLAPGQLAFLPDLAVSAKPAPGGELLLRYTVQRETKLTGDWPLHPGDSFEFIVPTTERLRAATASVRQMGGYVAGVVFFRWPTGRESLVLQPADVLAAAAGVPSKSPSLPKLAATNAGCAAFHCYDLVLDGIRAPSPLACHYTVRSSVPLDYFVPENQVSIRLTAPRTLELTLPPYFVARQLRLGRAMSLQAAEFSVEEKVVP